MVGFHAAIDRMLPVDPRRLPILGQQGKTGQIDILQNALHRAEERVEIEMALGVGMDDDDADLLMSRQRDQAAQLIGIEGPSGWGTLISSPAVS